MVTVGEGGLTMGSGRGSGGVGAGGRERQHLHRVALVVQRDHRAPRLPAQPCEDVVRRAVPPHGQRAGGGEIQISRPTRLVTSY
jgi:hypothetical protein